jgi:hypothetical protein
MVAFFPRPLGNPTLSERQYPGRLREFDKTRILQATDFVITLLLPWLE